MKSPHRQPQANVSSSHTLALAAAMITAVLAVAALSGAAGSAITRQSEVRADGAGQSSPRPPEPAPPAGTTSSTSASSSSGATLTATPSPSVRSYGVPAGTALRPSGDVVVRTPGTVIDGLDVQGCITVLAPSVVIKNTRVRGSCDSLINNRSTGLVVQDVELDGGGNPSVQGIGWGDFTARGLHIHGVGDGVRANGNVVLESSYIHDLSTADGSHNDGVQVTQGSNIVIRGNVIENSFTQTSAILIGAHQGSVSNVLVEGNLLAGGGYTLYGGADPRLNYTISNILLRNNVFSTRFYPTAGRYGPITATDDANITVSGNVWQATGLPIG